MDRQPKRKPHSGGGAMPLLLRLMMVRRRSPGRESLAERGYSLAVALIASFVLLLGVGALASRGQLGFVGQVFQTQNRQARDVAEAAIEQFADTMNREENRHLLIANNTGDWTTNPDNRNVCTLYENDGTLTTAGTDPTNPDDFDPVDATAVNRFLPDGTFRPLVGNDNSRRFRVENIAYLNSDRGAYDASTRDSMRDGATRALIRVTIVGQVEQNNRISQSRVAREFEIVPKCCKRSFGANAATNWGRDRTSCKLEDPNLGSPQFRVGLNGGETKGSKNQLDVRDQNGDLISQAVCWAGTEDGSFDADSALDPNADTSACENGELAIGNTKNANNLGITFSPALFDVVLPVYAENPSDEPLATALGNEAAWAGYNIPHTTLTISGTKYMYYDGNQMQLCSANYSKTSAGYSPTSKSSCVAFPTVATPSSGNQSFCYERISADDGASPPQPYPEVNCRLRNLDFQGSPTVFIDTSTARINIFFDDSTLGSKDEYISGGGGSDFVRVHCRWGDAGEYTYGASGVCGEPLQWINSASPGNDFNQQCTGPDGSECGLGVNYKLDYFNVSELLNIYANGSGNFTLNGGQNTVGFNIYAPKASVTLLGGGNADPNFMGRLWVDDLTLTGNISIRVPNDPPSDVDDDLTGLNSFWDFIARSFTQSSGF